MPVATSTSNGGQVIILGQRHPPSQECVPERCKNWSNTQRPVNLQQRPYIQCIPENKEPALTASPHEKPQVYVSLASGQRQIPPPENILPQAQYQPLPQFPSNQMLLQQPAMPPPIPQAVPQMAPVSPNYTCIWVPYLETLSLSEVNISCMPSQDPAGKDLPNSDLNSLRFFFNLGVEYYHMMSNCCSMTVTDVSPEIPQNVNTNGQFPPPHQFSIPPPTFYSSNAEDFPLYYPSAVPDAQDADKPSINQNVNNSTFSETNETHSDIEEGKNSSPHDSGCESDCASGSRNSKYADITENFQNSDSTADSQSDYVDKKSDDDATSIKLDQENQSEINDHAKEYSFKPKRKYYMYGNHKLIKPIKDIPPRFQMMLAESSAAKARCEGQPIILPSPMPQNVDISPDMYGNVFNPDATCFIPGNPGSSDTGQDGQCTCNGSHNPSDSSCSSDLLYTVHVYGCQASSSACSSSGNNNGAGCTDCLTNTSTQSALYTGGYGNETCLAQGTMYYSNQHYPMTAPVPYTPSVNQFVCNGGQPPVVGPMPPPLPQTLPAQAPPPMVPPPMAPPLSKVVLIPAPQQQA